MSLVMEISAVTTEHHFQLPTQGIGDFLLHSVRHSWFRGPSSIGGTITLKDTYSY